MHPLALGIAVGAAFALLVLTKRSRRVYGSPTNASDAVDEIDLPADASADDVLDAGLQETFPASDPVAVGKAYKRADKAS